MERILFILGILEDEDVDWLVTTGNRREIASGEVLIREGELSRALYLVLSGQFVVSIARTRQTAIAYLTSGEVIGEMSFVDHLPPSATVTATEPSVVLGVEREALDRKLTQDVAFAGRWYHALAILLSTRLRSTVSHLEAEYWQPVVLEETLFSPDMADSMQLGNIRFDWLIRRLRDVDVPSWDS